MRLFASCFTDAKEVTMPKAIDVANYFLAAQTPENDITNLKLQKLCAYAQAMSLALLGRQLFTEELEAWTHGPVVPSLYWKFEKHNKDPLPSSGLSEKYAREVFDDEQKFILELTKHYYGVLSAWELRERSHRDFPGQFGSKRSIPPTAIQKAFENDPLVRKLKDNVTPCHFDPATDKLISEEEVFDALAL